jgi:hypothetical protein
MSPLDQHPFAVDATLRTSLVVGYAAPLEKVRALLPPQLQADTFDDTNGFLAVAFVDTHGLRPARFPETFGQRFKLIGYRIFVRLETAAGKRFRGLYILRSETDSRQMAILGNTFTSYNYTRMAIELHESPTALQVRNSLGLQLSVNLGAAPQLPQGSPFADWAAARRFSGPMPYTFSIIPGSNDILLVEGMRERWQPQAVSLAEARVPFLDKVLDGTARPANAFVIRDIAYHWKKGRRVQCR